MRVRASMSGNTRLTVSGPAMTMRVGTLRPCAVSFSRTLRWKPAVDVFVFLAHPFCEIPRPPVPLRGCARPSCPPRGGVHEQSRSRGCWLSPSSKSRLGERAARGLVARARARAPRRRSPRHARTQRREHREGGLSRSEFTPIDTTRLERAIFGAVRAVLGRASEGQTTNTALSTLPYYQFEQLVWRRFAARIFAGEFDLVHRLTPVTPAQPSTLAAKVSAAGVPFVLGPINGGLPWPKGFNCSGTASGSGSRTCAPATSCCPATRRRARRPRPSSPPRA